MGFTKNSMIKNGTSYSWYLLDNTPTLKEIRSCLYNVLMEVYNTSQLYTIDNLFDLNNIPKARGVEYERFIELGSSNYPDYTSYEENLSILIGRSSNKEPYNLYSYWASVKVRTIGDSPYVVEGAERGIGVYIKSPNAVEVDLGGGSVRPGLPIDGYQVYKGTLSDKLSYWKNTEIKPYKE